MSHEVLSGNLPAKSSVAEPPKTGAVAVDAVKTGSRNVLAEICARKREEVAQHKALAVVLQRPACFGAVRSMKAALSAPGTRFIMECKRASPSQGAIQASVRPAEIARDYRGVADVISVLTDGPYFGGALAHLAEVRAQVDVPLLRKDFIVDPFQVREAWAYGADAVLLMLSVLDDETWQRCAEEAASLGLETLTEVHDSDEMQRALALRAPIIGINNRDLKTLNIDLAVTHMLAAQVPAGTLLISESGIASHNDVRALARSAHRYLVGTQLMKAPRRDLAARELVYGAVKICGLTRAEDARAAYAAGAVYGGLIFATESPRKLDVLQAISVRTAAPLRWVGVFTTHALADIACIARQLDLSAVQLHGAYSEDDLASLRRLLPETVAIWAVRRVGADASTLDPTAFDTSADRILLDTAGAAAGGNGQRFNWRALQVLGRETRARVALAGGLAPGNIIEAAAQGVSLLDVNSGVESAPGIKDAGKLQELFSALRRAPLPQAMSTRGELS